MKRQGNGFVQLGDLRSHASWTAGTILSLRFPTDSFSEAEWQEVRHLRNWAGKVFLLCDGTADNDYHIIGHERDGASVTFHLATPYPVQPTSRRKPTEADHEPRASTTEAT